MIMTRNVGQNPTWGRLGL